MRHGALLSLLSLLMAVPMPALAVYKCESHGRTTYTDTPCGAAQSELPPLAPPSDPAGARRRAAGERSQLARIDKDLEQARASRERQQQRSQKDKADQAHKKKCTLLALEMKWSAEDASSVTRTVSDKTESLKRQARRKAERHEAECGANQRLQ
jgi:hypothetical protein